MQGRSALQVTWHVWHAVFMREIMARITADRMAAPWLIIEPVLHVFVMIGVRQLIGRGQLIPGADFISWLLLGILAFFVFRDVMTRSMNAINANQALFAYRQVHPFDPVFIRAVVELLLRSAVMLLMIGALNLVGHSLWPVNAIQALEAWLALWCFGFGCGLVFSVAITMLPESGNVVPLMIIPLYVLSGVMVPLQYLPHEIREVLILNPLVHGVEAIRLGFFPTYQVPYEVDLSYLWLWACSALLLGLMLHVRYKRRLTAQ
jgi:capsular polysaccharide transport system permease protein